MIQADARYRVEIKTSRGTLCEQVILGRNLRRMFSGEMQIVSFTKLTCDENTAFEVKQDDEKW